MEQSDNWRVAGEVPGGKGHLLTSIQRGNERASGFARAYTACNRLSWVRRVEWSDLLWDDDAWACKVCQRHVRDYRDYEQVHPQGSPQTPPENPDRAERLRLYVALGEIARQAALPGPVLKSRSELAAELLSAARREAAREAAAGAREQTISRMGARVNRDGKELDRLNELLTERELELNRLREDNRQLARMAARAEVLRDVVKSLFTE